MGTVQRFPRELCRPAGGTPPQGAGRKGNVVILPAIRIERHRPDAAMPALADKTSRRPARRRRQPRG